MDEILIEEKKYISSKRAAKITGYAKDYIGQLCREGRVPARLIGRGWYVLESAIQDHRFGDPGIESKKEEKEDSKPIVHSTWETPHYKASSEELLPSVNQLQDEKPSNIQDSWREWFNRFAENADASGSIEDLEPRDPESDERAEVSDEGKKEESESEPEAEEIPITIYKPLPEEFLPHRLVIHAKEAAFAEEATANQWKPIRKGRGYGAFMGALQVVGVMLALVTAVTAVLGTGYLDRYILSDSRVNVFAGVLLYDK